MYTVSRDYLGSILAIADSSGQAVERRTYDPWGRMTREALDSALCITDRGYTSHEHIEEIGLINMNARLYDPLIGRFFSPDPKMMDGETQALNRYSYAMNNPFAYTDPSGEELFTALILGFTAAIAIKAAMAAAAVGAAAAAVMTAVTLAKSGASAGEMAWKIPAAMLIGGAAGAAGGLLGAGMPAFGAAAAALSGVASVAASSLIGSTTSFLTGGNTLSVGLLSYNFNRGGLENPFGSVQQSIFSAMDIAGMVLPAVGGVASALTKTARGAASAESSVLSPENRQRLQAVWDDKHPRGRLLGGGPGGVRVIDPETFVPAKGRLYPKRFANSKIADPSNWRAREAMYSNRPHVTTLAKIDWLTGKFKTKVHKFRTTDTHYMRVRRNKNVAINNSHSFNETYNRLTNNGANHNSLLIKVQLQDIQSRFIDFPYSRLTEEQLRALQYTKFKPVLINGKKYVSITLPRLPQ
ncbi:Cell wall-associated polypeptide CWBP200 [Bacteroidales bacterium Barb6XT]|nr:Cell wall-associated polypeptide CWBP200 [Bacteroidales bacterium Barb6XT]